ncbi:hypothetical protein FOMPIDRAFT_1055052 [Fomitopsis schrenkii]|uniref:Uncharacterized protein n=1 Tax=Fomitopsis schrenkii TaxID=2126942 RepID=S8DLY5_FOMSC|nr:hypothetical protein FOMPIDRAFT_1055052 [Fomitopsis schrenkii]
MSIPVDCVLFLASGSFVIESTLDPDACVDWEPCTVAIMHVAPLRAAMYLVNSNSNRPCDSFASEFSADWAISEVNDPQRLMSWTSGDTRYRVHLQNDNRLLFLSLVIDFTTCLARATQLKQAFEDQVMGYLHTLPPDLARLEGLVINDRGRVERVAVPFVPEHNFVPQSPPRPEPEVDEMDHEE